MEIKIVRGRQALDSVRADWSQILTRCPSASVFQTLEWHQAWLDVFGTECEPVIFLAIGAAGAAAIAPMAISQRRVNGGCHRSLSFIGAGNRSSDYCDFIFDPARPEGCRDLVEAILDFGDFSLAEFSNLRPSSPLIQLLHQAPRSTRVVMCQAPAIDLSDRSHAEQLPSRKSLKRHFNFFRRSGDLQFKLLREMNIITEALPVFFEQHTGRWADAPTPSLFLHQSNRLFYRRLAELFLPVDVLRFSAVYFNERPIAFHFGFEYRGVFTWYKPSFDISLQAKSPGEVLLKYLFEYCLEKGLREFDFTVGDEAFKYRFCNVIRPIVRARAFRSTVPYLIDRARAGLGGWMRSRLSERSVAANATP